MKCSFCGNQIPDGVELCPSCGMILSLGDSEADNEIRIPEYTPNVFGSSPERFEEPVAVVKEEPIIAVPEYDPDKIVINLPQNETEVIAEPEAVQAEYAVQEDYSAQEPEEAYTEVTVEDYDNVAEESAEETVADIDETIAAQDGYAEEADEAIDEEEIDDVAYPVYEAFAEDVGDEDVVDDVLSEENAPVIVPVEDEVSEDAPVAIVVPEESATQEEPEEEVGADDDDTYVKPSKKGGVPAIIALCLLLVCLVVAGGYIVKNVIPEKKPGTTEPYPIITTTQNNSDDDITDTLTTEGEADTTEESTALTTEESTSAAEEETTAEETTDAPTTTVPSTTRPTTTRPSTTRPTTTRPSTTRPATTRPTTTRPTTTKPTTTTDPYGINDVDVKKPTTYLTTPYTGYVTKGSKMLSKPSGTSERVQYIEKGSELIVYATENGYSYVRSTRFGTYGWVESALISQSRPVESTTTVKNETVLPDVNASGETMYTTYTINLRLGPSTGYGVIKTIPINYPVKVIGYKSGVSGWAYVTDLTTGTNGWVSTDYLK